MNEQNNISNAVVLIKTAILQSQARAAAAANQEQLALYYGIGKFISLNTRNKSWGTGAIKQISENIKAELPGIKGFGERNLKNMRTFYEEWSLLESKTADASAEIQPKTADASAELLQGVDSEMYRINPLQLVSPISPRYLVSFRSFYQMRPNYKILQTRLQNLTWSHVLKVLRVYDSTAQIGQPLVAQLKKIFASILNINRSPMANDLQSVSFSAHPLHLFFSWMCDYALSFTKRIA